MTGPSKKYVNEYLDRCYGSDWPNYAYQTFDHANEKSIKKVKIKLSPDEKLPA